MIDARSFFGKAVYAGAFFALAVGLGELLSCYVSGSPGSLDAAAFVLAGASLALALRATASQARAARPLSVAAGGTGLLVAGIGLAECAVSWRGGVLFVLDGSGGIALSLSALGMALLGLPMRRRIGLIVKLAAAAVGLYAAFILVGHCYDSELFSAHDTSISTPFMTALVLLVLSASLLLTQADRGLLAVLIGDSAGGIAARRLLLGTVVFLPLLNGLTRLGEEWGFYHGALGEALETIGNLFFFTCLICWNARLLSHWDGKKREVEKDLRWKTAFFEAQLDASSDGVLVVDSQGRCLVQNRRCIEQWNLPPAIADAVDDELRLRWVTAMTAKPEEFARKVHHLFAHPDERSVDEIELNDGRTFDRFSAPVVGADGTYYGRIWTFHDVTERKQIEETLRESEARFQRIAANVPGMVFQFVRRPGGEGEFSFVSDGCREVYGFEPEALLRDVRLSRSVVHPDDQADFDRSIAESAAGLAPWDWRGRIVRPETGEVRCLHGTSRPAAQSNGDVLWDGVVIDITERKEAEENRRAKEEADRSNKEKSRFLSRMSHELRTPLNAILGFGQVLEFSDLPEQDAQALGFMLEGGRHLLSLVDEVLDLSRAETGELCLTPKRVDAAEVAQKCVGLVARLAEARRIRCTLAAPGGPATLWCDEHRLRQLLLNLLSNAIKYNREGGAVTLACESRPGERLRISVHDTGPGLTPSEIARLFVPFERLRHEDGEIEGTGLGLVVSRRVAEAMGGSVGVESTPGEGSTFWIELPLAPEDDPAAASLDDLRADAPPGGSAEASPEASLLYIEDNAPSLQAVEMLLTRRRPQWRFLSARDGKTGLAQARESLPDLVLLDYQLPDTAGDAVLAELRGDPRTSRIPVVMLSADATASTRARLLNQGVNDYLCKPFQVDNLLDVLDRYCVSAGTEAAWI